MLPNRCSSKECVHTLSSTISLHIYLPNVSMLGEARTYCTYSVDNGIHNLFTIMITYISCYDNIYILF